MGLLVQALSLGTLGFVAGLIGSLIGALGARQSAAMTSYVQHFAAGLIIAAATLDLIPEARHVGGGWALLVGFALGTAFMIGLRGLMEHLGHGAHGHSEAANGHAAHGQVEDAHTDEHPARVGLNLPLVAALAVVVLIDGSIIGVSLTTGETGATLIAIALATELLFVAASTSGSTRSAGGGAGVAIAAGAGVALMLPIGTVAGAWAFAGASSTLLVGALGFAGAVLLFTAIEELLLEAHEIRESAGTAAMGALGFLIFLGLQLLWPAAG